MTNLRHVIAGAVGPELTDHLLERLEYFGCRIVSEADIAAIREKALEEAAQTAEKMLHFADTTSEADIAIAGAIRALKDDGRTVEASE